MHRFIREALRRDWLLYFGVAAVFVFGLLLGALKVNFLHPAQAEKLYRFVEAFARQVPGIFPAPGQLLWEAVSAKLAVILLFYLLGLSFLGIPFILALVFFEGFALGFTLALICRCFPWPKGAVLSLCTFLPQHALYLPALLLGAGGALSFSLLLVPRPSSSFGAVWPSLLNYTALMFFALAMAAGGVLVEAFLTPWLAKLTLGFLG